MTGLRSTTIALAAVILAGCAPIYTWDINTTSTARTPAFDIGELSNQPVATAGLVAPAALQGFNASMSFALESALTDLSPPIRALPAREIVNALNDQGLTSEYGDVLAGFARTGVMDRERLQRIGSALGFRYVLLPGLAQFDHGILDRFEIAGVKVIRTRVTLLRVWLQLWDARTGHIVWESAGEVATAYEAIRHDRVVPLGEIAQKVWRRMLQNDLLEGKTGSRSLFNL